MDHDLDLTKIRLSWTEQIVAHIEKVLDSKTMSAAEKLTSITWLIRQLKTEKQRE